MAKQISTVKSSELHLEIDLDKFQLEDWEILDFSKGRQLDNGTTSKVTPMNEVLDVLDRLVIGGVRGRGFNGQQLFEIITQVNQALQAGMNPVRNGKN